jgi:hypothetical protein
MFSDYTAVTGQTELHVVYITNDQTCQHHFSTDFICKYRNMFLQPSHELLAALCAVEDRNLEISMSGMNV